MHRLVFIHSTPDDTPARQKMMYATTKDTFKSLLDGISADVCGDPSEIDEAAILYKVKGNMTATGK